jgi:hypothetical protein
MVRSVKRMSKSHPNLGRDRAVVVHSGLPYRTPFGRYELYQFLMVQYGARRGT